ncbi:MAG: hypothetical protein ACUVWP_09495 [bacterium]
MKIRFLIILFLIANATTLPYQEANHRLSILVYSHSTNILCPKNPVSTKDMKYHDTPYYYWTLNGQDWCLAVHYYPKENYKMIDGNKVIRLVIRDT